MDDNYCYTCENGFFLYEGDCINTCPDGTFYDNVNLTCDSCDSSCKTCEDNATKCISCNNTEILSNN